MPELPEMIEAAAKALHDEVDGHGCHPDDPHYCWPEHRDEYIEGVNTIFTAAGVPELLAENERLKSLQRTKLRCAELERLLRAIKRTLGHEDPHAALAKIKAICASAPSEPNQ